VTDSDMTLHEAAAELGVHYMTAYRYVRLGQLPATKTGGIWRVSAADLRAFRSAGTDVPVGAPRRRAPWTARLEGRLVAGDTAGAWQVLEAAMASGMGLEELYLDVVGPVMTAIGAGWERGEIDVGVEHRATGIAVRLLGRLGPRFARRGRTRGTVVLGTPAGERHALPVSLVADLLSARGFEVSDLGADVPPASFAAAVEAADRLVVVGVNLTGIERAGAARATIAAVRSVADVPILVGGRAVPDVAAARALGADTFTSSGRAVLSAVEQVAEGAIPAAI
jgi:MerR family transcriptional regulator, light-induced transcriptional regulator